MNFRVRNLLIIIFLALFAAYFIYEAQDYLYGFSAEIIYPADGQYLESSAVTVRGKVTGAAFITLNGRQILTDESGMFAEELLLAPGINVIDLEAKSRFGEHIRKTSRVVLKYL